MSRSTRRSGSRALFFLTALIAGAAGYLLWTHYHGFANAPVSGIEAGSEVVVERGDSFARVLAKLRAAGVSDGGDLEWQVLARELGAAGRLQVGEYALEPGMTPRELLLRIRDGKVVGHRFTIVEGWNIHQLRGALAEEATLRHETDGLDDAALMKALGHPGQHPEGRFLPETYVYTRGDSDLDVLGRAYDALDKALRREWDTRQQGLPLSTPEQALILASIVEKETGVADERPRIAGVFVRRLQRGMLLQTDPTVIYGMGSAYDGNIRKRDLLADSPYNTYLRAGLPPTPIAMPGVASLHAATHPAPGDAVYFVAVGDGSGRHLFASTLSQHQANVRSFLQRYRRQRQDEKR